MAELATPKRSAPAGTPSPPRRPAYVASLDSIPADQRVLAGGKGANLAELVEQGANVPPGFVVLSNAFESALVVNGLGDAMRKQWNGNGPPRDPSGYEALSQDLRRAIEAMPLPRVVEREVRAAYRHLCKETRTKSLSVAVRSSATSEDQPDASFAGQQETFLNVKGEEGVLEHVRKCWSSLYTPRALFYRDQKNYSHDHALIAVVVQKLVDARAAGVAFTMDPVTGDRSRIVVEATWGLGESVVAGRVRPDRYVVDKSDLTILQRDLATKAVELVRGNGKSLVRERAVPPERQQTPCLSDDMILRLAEQARSLEAHFGTPQDIEFAVEGSERDIEDLFLLQARPETVWSQKSSTPAPTEGPPVLKGLAASPGVFFGPAKIVLTTSEAKDRIQAGDILVTKMTNPDWVPYMKIAGAIVAEDGGTTCHAAIVSREMGVPCIVGARGATRQLAAGQSYTVDAKAGAVYAGRVDALLKPAKAATAIAPVNVPVTSTKVYVNLSIPELAERTARETQADGVGLLRAEHLMLSVGKHPRLLIEEGGAGKMVEAFASGIRQVAAPFSPRPIIYRFLDFKPDEFLEMPGGEKYERDAGHVGPNPLIGYRGCYRYRKEPDIFRLECQAIRKVRDEFKLKNVHVMLPFVRTLEDLRFAKRLMAEEGLKRGPDFKLWIMVEVPSTVLCIDQFVAEGIDGVFFGTNDLTMLILGIDRDDASIQEIYDERNPAVLRAMSHVIRECRDHGVTTSICGQAPSNYPEMVEYLVRQGATSLSVNRDKVVETKTLVAGIERKLILEATRTLRKETEPSLAFKHG